LRLRTAIFLFLFCLITGRSKAAEEFIIISGGPSLEEWERYKAEPHDRWWGNFIRSARVRIQELQKKHGADVMITWLVHRPSYERRALRQDRENLISHIESVRDRYKVRLLWFREGSEVMNHIVSGHPRDRVKIANLEFFGHSNRACWMFDYSNEIDSGSKSWLHESELTPLRRNFFTRRPFIKSWGCHTGESMSRKWRRSSGHRMIGAIGKTDYSNGHLRNWIPDLSKGARWGG
jgi:hypothetical protein